MAFAGHEWWVIGDDTSGVYPQPGHITLMTVNPDFGTSFFRATGKNGEEGHTVYRGWNYINNPEGMDNWTTPNEYAGSSLQQKMEEIADGFPEKEQAAISTRDFIGSQTYQNPSVDGIAGQGIDDQRLWALSSGEVSVLGSGPAGSLSLMPWLRSPFASGKYGDQGLTALGTMAFITYVHEMQSNVYPALSLNMSSVFFSSDASETTGKSGATVGSNLIRTEPTSGITKFTMKDSSQTLTVIATEEQSTQTGQTFFFTYSNATTGINQYISCILTDTNTGEVKYYGKLADSSNASSGTLSIPLDGIADGTYTLQIFSEEANGYLYTDFCSEPITMSAMVADGTGTVSNFGGTTHYHNWSDTWNSDDNYHWHECTATGCMVTDNSQKDGYGEHTTDGSGWHSDETNHWNICECGKMLNEAAHTYEWVTDKDATATEAGSKHEECKICGYQKAAVEIPATGTTEEPSKDNPGAGETDIPQTGDNSNTALWIGLMLAAGAFLTGTVLYNCKKKYSR